MQNKIPLVVFLAGILSKASCDLPRLVLIDEPQNWTEAQSYCREKYVDLATVQSDKDRAKLQKAATAGNFASDAWIGLYKNVWRWSHQYKPVSNAKWDSSQPDLPETMWVCGNINNNGKWSDRYCHETDSFFCQNEYTQTQYKFVYIYYELNWTDAQKYCRKHYVDLATVIDDDENEFLANKLSSLIPTAWIGLIRGPWQWSDNSGVSGSMKWQPGQPDDVKEHKCVRASTNALMAVDNCSTPLPFYCHENRRMQRVRFTVRSDGLLDQSAVKWALEEKMKQILSDQDLKIKSSITWSVQPDGNIFQTHKTQQQKTMQLETCKLLQPMTG